MQALRRERVTWVHHLPPGRAGRQPEADSGALLGTQLIPVGFALLFEPRAGRCIQLLASGLSTRVGCRTATMTGLGMEHR